jgi:hypothetical protein
MTPTMKTYKISVKLIPIRSIYAVRAMDDWLISAKEKLIQWVIQLVQREQWEAQALEWNPPLLHSTSVVDLFAMLSQSVK